jgi:hypothetical protein
MLRLGHDRVLYLGVLCGRGGGGVLVPLTFNISYSMWLVGLSNHIMLSSRSPVFWGFLTIIMSPLSLICRPHRRA